MKKIFEERIVGVCDRIAGEGWSISLSVKLVKLRKEICKKDPERMTALLDEYDNLSAGIHCRTIDRVYVQGFKDAVSLLKS